jgi:uncharacterized membrane protein
MDESKNSPAATGDHVDGWAAVLQPDCWCSTDAAELREIVMAEPDE